ncbi:MAG: hypothetical protein NDJ89_06330 [Oligoflexia bacterium]|nr:hypothetical protein [Oligoflexia bacterium]
MRAPSAQSPQNSPLKLGDILEASYERLLEFARYPTASPLVDVYRDVLLAFLRGDSERLRSECDRIRVLPHSPEFLLPLACLRLSLQARDPDSAQLESLISLADRSGEWRGEILIACGHGYELRGELGKAKEIYLKASEALLSAGFERKALRAYINSVAMEGQLHPEKKLLAEFHSISRQARKLREFRSCGIALSNIAREYRNIRALDTALKYANHAVRYLKKELGTLYYYKALTNRCHILYEMDRVREAQIDFEEARHADFPEIKAALQVIEQLLNPTAEIEIAEKDLLPLWRERLKEGRIHTRSACKLSRRKLGELEEALIKRISEKPADKFELIEFLYGNNADFHALEARLKSLLSRIRRKCPGLLLLDGGKYRIADRILLPSFLREAG